MIDATYCHRLMGVVAARHIDTRISGRLDALHSIAGRGRVRERDNPLAAGFESAARQNGRRHYIRIIRVIRFHEKA